MPVVYDGTVGSSHGDLFRGLKLFISYRVPQRERWVNIVKGNGGEVVVLESQADMLIADHVKRNGALPPPGSYSWKWIEYSVRNGFLQTQDDYRIEGAPARAAGASAPTKGQRAKFTKEDDDLLADFVWEKERQGSKIKGNVIFQELDEKYPNRHTPQSWRDRWVKYVSNRPRPNVPQENPPPDARPGASPAGHRRPVDQPPQSHGGPSNVQSTPARSPDSTPGKEAQGRTRFTKEDDEELLNMIRETRGIAADKGKPVRGLDGNKIFEDLAAKNKRHSAHSWRNRWVRHLKATFEQEILETPDEAEEVPESPAEPPKPQTRGSRETTAPRTQAKGTTASSSAAVSAPKPPTPQRSRPGSDDERLKRQEERKRRARAAVLLQRTWRGHVFRRDRAQLESSIVPLQSLIRGYILRMRKAERLLDVLERKTEPLEDDRDEDAEQYEDAQEDLNSEVDGDDSSLRDQFYEDLRDYIDVSGAEIEPNPTIDGREIDLWELYSIATQQDCAAENRDWKQVAQRLGFDWTSPTGCAKELRECYDRNLAEFEEAIGSYDDQDGTAVAEDERVSRGNEEEALVQTSDAVTAPKQPSRAPLSPIYRPSSPIAGVKRSFQQSNDSQSELGYPSDRSSKRRRRDRETAIPQTPEHKLRFAGGSSSRAAVQDCSSPLKSRGAATEAEGMYSMDDADAFLDNDIHDIQEIDQLPDPAPARKRRFIEPETQDFGLAIGCEADARQSTERDNNGYMTDEDDNSPSQQLRSEFDAFSSPSKQKVSATSTWAEQSSAQQHNPSRKTPASSAPVPGPARTAHKTDSPEFGEEYVDAQFEHFTALGYGIRQIGQALEVSSLQRGPMTVALQSLASGKGIPQNVTGVWTDEDDEKLRKIRAYDRKQKAGVASSSSGEMAREKAKVERYRSDLLTKHQSWFAHRVAFMNMMDREAAAK
ncbi:hypothetical protein F5883DRAFT_614321 [Diaporthe sp. PMI_573]|nr:hypothetical protein F5883DRAFT_614321 [Diaporthaceae sp. PMI_573]